MPQLEVRVETALHFFPKGSFFPWLLASGGAFALLDAMLPHTPLSVEEINARKGKPVPRLFSALKLEVALAPNHDNEARISAHNGRPRRNATTASASGGHRISTRAFANCAITRCPARLRSHCSRPTPRLSAPHCALMEWEFSTPSCSPPSIRGC
jgi:hypothetical protein